MFVFGLSVGVTVTVVGMYIVNHYMLKKVLENKIDDLKADLVKFLQK